MAAGENSSNQFRVTNYNIVENIQLLLLYMKLKSTYIYMYSCVYLIVFIPQMCERSNSREQIREGATAGMPPPVTSKKKKKSLSTLFTMVLYIS